jgi:RNA polymerase sigma factor (sigma-70 family)
MAPVNGINALDTRATLLLRIRDLNDRVAWSEFVALYMPLLYAYALKRGLQDADAADVAQDSMCDVVRAILKFEYDSAKGSFRGWLLTVMLNQIRRRFQAKKDVAQASGNSAILELLKEQPSPTSDEDWEREYQMHLFHWAANRVRSEFRENTWHAFWLTTVDNRPVEEVAKELKISVGAVYIARSRVLARIRVEVEKVEQLESHHVR